MNIFSMILTIVIIADIVLTIVYCLIVRSKNKMIDDFVAELHASRRQEETHEKN